MKMQSQALLFGIESSKGTFEGTAFDSTKFHLSVDLGQKSTGETIGLVTRPFKFGDSTEIQKWMHLKAHFAAGKPVLCNCEFDVVAGSGTDVKLTLLGIQAAPANKTAAAAS
ncbi:hypothetical protein [Comamonas sp. HJ-2]